MRVKQMFRAGAVVGLFFVSAQAARADVVSGPTVPVNALCTVNDEGLAVANLDLASGISLDAVCNDPTLVARSGAASRSPMARPAAAAVSPKVCGYADSFYTPDYPSKGQFFEDVRWYANSGNATGVITAYWNNNSTGASNYYKWSESGNTDYEETRAVNSGAGSVTGTMKINGMQGKTVCEGNGPTTTFTVH